MSGNKCWYCKGLHGWSGDAPLPYPLLLGMRGLIEAHCGYDGAPSPRFSFICPVCSGEVIEANAQIIGGTPSAESDG